MDIRPVPLSHLVASSQPRPLLTAEVDKLASSIKEIGLIQPITVAATTVMHGVAEPGWKIVAGHHRVAAVRALGWKEIDAIVIDNEKNLQNELVEIDENLCRAELTNGQRTAYTKRRKQIWEALHPKEKSVAVAKDATKLEVGQVGQLQVAKKHGGSRPHDLGFVASTAAVTGESERSIRRDLARAYALGDSALDKITGTSLDSGVEMDALIRLPEPEREALIERAVAGEKVSAKPASTAAQTLRRHPPIAESIKKALRGVLDDFGCMSVRDLIPIIRAQDAQDEVQEIFESWHSAVYPVDVMALPPGQTCFYQLQVHKNIPTRT